MLQKKMLEEVYDECISSGFLQSKRVLDVNKVHDNLKISENDMNGGKTLLSEQNWGSAYKLFYDSLHLLVETFLMFDSIKSFNHQCLFAFLCLKHPELELDWNFFERIRVRRNGINYYGRLITEDDWKEDKIGFELYTSLLRKEITKKLKDN
ncbi:hypothetical protein JW756_06585 [Candidatus Woesearchaeota archaeon]|nr:hypothetical protein [Candidatus Woesearchaeota archaeon]